MNIKKLYFEVRIWISCLVEIGCKVSLKLLKISRNIREIQKISYSEGCGRYDIVFQELNREDDKIIFCYDG